MRRYHRPAVEPAPRCFKGGPGTIKLNAVTKNRSSGATNALTVALYDTRANRLCYQMAGNVNTDKAFSVDCTLDKAQPLILRLDLAPETIDYSVVTIALDAAVLFDTGKSVLKPEARQTLHEAAERIKKFATSAVAVSGHTDNVGSDAANQALSDKRAQAVRDHLVQQEGVPAARLTAKGHGKTQPVADNATDAGRARNRRVDIVISAWS